MKLNRRNLFARDRNQCQYCGRHFPTADLSIDHVMPRARGGGDTWENLVCACIKCNARKGGRTPEQAGMQAHAQARSGPKRNPLITLRLGSEKYASWKAFLDEAYWSVDSAGFRDRGRQLADQQLRLLCHYEDAKGRRAGGIDGNLVAHQGC